MTVNPRHDFKPCAPGAFNGGLRRTEFFDGMVLSEADMKREQSYWQMKRRLTNRALGQGVVWGLNVVWDEKSRCFTVCPGYGVSCCGEDLVVECPETVCERDLIDPCSADFKRLFAHPANPCGCDPDPRGSVEACLMLEYVEYPEDPRQIFEDACAEVAGGCRYGAVRETTRLRLVPPPAAAPPGPIEAFCKKIEGIRAHLADDGIELPDPAFTPAGPAVIVGLGAFDVNGQGYGSREAEVPLEAGQSAFASLPASSGIDELEVRLSPPPGYVFAAVTVDNDPPRTLETMMGFTTRQTRSGLDTYSNRLQIEMIPFVGGGQRHIVAVDLKGRVSADGFEVMASVSAAEARDTQADCQSLLENWLVFDADPACVLRTLALALTCGWFKGQLGQPACADGGEPDQVQQDLAWLVCWVTWQYYWGIDITQDNAKGVETCLQALFEAWCEGFHYKGPRCDTDAHGVILGCMKISPKGRIECFDAWAHRRHVLTGPLISHWGGQLGLAPMDVVAGRLASWLCCIARAPMPSQPETGLGDLTGILPLGSLSVAVGQNLSVNESISGARIASVREVSTAGFVSAALSGLSQSTASASGATAVDAIRAPGGKLHLMVPAVDGGAAAPASRRAIEELALAEVSVAPPMARRATVEMMEAVAAEVPLSRLKLAGEAEAHSAVLEALEAAEISTLADLLVRDAEDVSDTVRPALLRAGAVSEPEAADKLLGQVFGAALGTVRAAGAAIAAEGAAREDADSFTRADMAEAGTVAAVRKATNSRLKARGLSEASVRALAKRVAGQR